MSKGCFLQATGADLHGSARRHSSRLVLSQKRSAAVEKLLAETSLSVVCVISLSTSPTVVMIAFV